MKKIVPILGLAASVMLYLPVAEAAKTKGNSVPASEPFQGRVLVEGLGSPWEMVWGPDDHLWVTERTGKRITRVNPKTGATQVLATLDEAVTGNQQGVLGLALSPDFLKEGGQNFVYVVCTYKDGNDLWTKIVRYEYQPSNHKLVSPTPIIDKMPAGDDHNAGRLIFGPDGKLYYSHGEQGHNQGNNVCKPIEAQRLPTEKEMTDKNWASYVGKVLRMNVDGSVPDDNPVINGIKSHVFTYGHRNPQGLVFVGKNLFSVEHGPSTDDEINLLKAGGNYGWPHVAGFRDNQSYVYANWSAASDCATLSKKYDPNTIPEGVSTQKETDWTEDFIEPLKTFHTVPNGYNFNDKRCASMPYLCWPTIGPSSVTYYLENGPIPGWENSLLVSTLKNGAIYRLKLNDDLVTVQGDEVKYFRTDNRYRSVLVAPDSRTIYVATDSEGNGFAQDGTPTQKMANPGSILEFTYTGDARKTKK